MDSDIDDLLQYREDDEIDPYQLAIEYTNDMWPEEMKVRFVEHSRDELKEWYGEDISGFTELIKTFCDAFYTRPSKEKFIESRGKYGASPDTIPEEFKDNKPHPRDGTNEFYRASRELDWISQKLDKSTEINEDSSRIEIELKLGEFGLGARSGFNSSRYAFFESESLDKQEAENIANLIMLNDRDDFNQWEIPEDTAEGQIWRLHRESPMVEDPALGIEVGNFVELDSNQNVIDIDIHNSKGRLYRRNASYRLEMPGNRYGRVREHELREVVENNLG